MSINRAKQKQAIRQLLSCSSRLFKPKSNNCINNNHSILFNMAQIPKIHKQRTINDKNYLCPWTDQKNAFDIFRMKSQKKQKRQQKYYFQYNRSSYINSNESLIFANRNKLQIKTKNKIPNSKKRRLNTITAIKQNQTPWISNKNQKNLIIQSKIINLTSNLQKMQQKFSKNNILRNHCRLRTTLI